jgi:hypothetical protein
MSQNNQIGIVNHEVVPNCGSFEVRHPGGREYVYGVTSPAPSRRLRPEILTREQALERGIALARDPTLLNR